MSKITTEGYYNVTVAQAIMGESSRGTPQICLVLVGENGDNIRGYRYFSDSCAQRSVDELVAAFKPQGWDCNFSDVTEGGMLPALEGLECRIKVQIEEFNGNPMARVAFINPIGSGGAANKALSDTSILKKLSAMAGVAVSPAAATPAKPKPQDIEDDPFGS